mmetsp:Transcript_31433/g.43759  ORF Transcript_31433/g.43759 Transcript_31433/m.43759 type:complete len:230 (+) Transcript_31433:464-1153(+)
MFHARFLLSCAYQVLCHPKYFLRPDLVKIFPFSASERYHKRRGELHHKLVSLIRKALHSPETRALCFADIQRRPETKWYNFFQAPIGAPFKPKSTDWELVFGASVLLTVVLEVVAHIIGWSSCRPIKGLIYPSMKYVAMEAIFPMIEHMGLGIGERSLILFNSIMFSERPAEIAEGAAKFAVVTISNTVAMGRQALPVAVNFSVNTGLYLGSVLFNAAYDFAVLAWKSM